MNKINKDSFVFCSYLKQKKMERFKIIFGQNQRVLKTLFTKLFATIECFNYKIIPNTNLLLSNIVKTVTLLACKFSRAI